jgi:hypothetical protein
MYIPSTTGTNASSPFSDVNSYIIIRNLLYSIFDIFPVFIRTWEIETYKGIFYPEVAYTSYDVPGS